ncbi:MAG TPA: DUF4062 domain-containing protein [Bryobacteraceae bacterium]|jgi:hypothetical protein|nr:DUF4062 domain-containing protein [Bryobacteraceae bacterium]
MDIDPGFPISHPGLTRAPVKLSDEPFGRFNLYDYSMDRRYQVFVSSTFEDLREERASVIGCLLQLDCFPTGMELFPAADDDSLTLIKSVIDDSDYYLVLLAGRYGSCPPGDERSFTHVEYDYAVTSGKPTIALLHSNPGLLPADKTERSDDGRRRLDEFRETLKRKNCSLWKDQAELTSAVFTGVQHLKKTRPSVGWIRGSELDGEGLKDELIRLRREIDSLNGELAVAKLRAAPEGLEELAQGADATKITIEFEGSFSLSVRWDSLMRAILPLTFGGGAPPEAIDAAIISTVRKEAIEMELPMSGYLGLGSRSCVPKRLQQGL